MPRMRSFIRLEIGSASIPGCLRCRLAPSPLRSGAGNASSEYVMSLKLINLAGQATRPALSFFLFGRLVVPGRRRMRSMFCVPCDAAEPLHQRR